MTTAPTRLFEPLKIRGRALKNRIVSTPHATCFATDGVITERLIDYHERKARGGVGLVMVFGSASVSRGSSASYGSVALWKQDNDAALTNLARRVHAHAALLISQASHLGRRGDSRLSGTALLAPGTVPEAVHNETPHRLDTGEIATIIADFAAAAHRLERCGFDGIEITSYGCHLIEQFWSPAINDRTDCYGGSLENRMRFSIEVVNAVAAVVSPRFLIAFRMTGDPLTDVLGLDRADMLQIACELDRTGRIDLFDISGGSGATAAAQAATVPPDTFPTGCFNTLARAVREAVSVPVIAAGRNLDVPTADLALRNGDCDLVAMTRAIIADPDLPAKAAHGEIDRIRPCIAINDACIGRLYMGMPIRCAVNPTIGRAYREHTGSAEPAQRVVVIGGGPAGLEAARVARLHGHTVTLLERDGHTGGQVTLAARARWRPHLEQHVLWQARELRRVGGEIRTGVSARVGDVLALHPDTVIVATGADTIVPSQARTAAVACLTDIDLLSDRAMITRGTHVTIYDREGELRGAGAALLAADAGAASVEIITPLPAVCAALDATQRPALRRDLELAHVRCTPDLELVNVGETLELRSIWTGSHVSRDNVELIVFVGFRKARDTVARELSATRPGLRLICAGDCVAPRRLADAVADGAAAGSSVGESSERKPTSQLGY